MKKTIINIVFLSFLIHSYGQCLYSDGQTINGNGFTYKCKDYWGGFKLYNGNNVWTFTEQAMKDGSHFKGDLDETPEPYKTNLEAVQTAFKVVYSTLSKAELEMIEGESIVIKMYINSDTGIITEVDFSFLLSQNKWCRIAPEKYYAIEQQIKNSGIRFTMTEQGKKYNYNFCWVPVKYRDIWYDEVLEQ